MSSLRDNYVTITNPPLSGGPAGPPGASGDDSTGWGFYVDNATAGSGGDTPLIVPQGSTVGLTNDKALTTLEDQIPTDAPDGFTFWDGARFRTINANDALLISIRFSAFASINAGGFNLALDISAAGDGSIIVGAKPIRMIRGSGIGNQQVYSMEFAVFTGSTFLANGARPLFTSVDGITTISDINFYVERQHKARS